MMTFSTSPGYYQSPHAPIFAGLVAAGRAISEALDYVRTEERRREVASPEVYVSTAISSGGYKRDASLTNIRDVITANNRTAGLLVGSLATSPGVITGTDCMLPTEIGSMTFASGRSWADTDYLEFYFAYAAGLSVAATEKMENSFATPDYASLLGLANDRNRTNDERWPAYRAFTEVTLAKVQGLLRIGGAEYEPFPVMLQLVDVEISLGCRAEELYASYFGLDLVMPAIARDRLAHDDPLGPDLDTLSELGAVVGVAASAVMPVAHKLDRDPAVP
jgi:hypothetical protein